MGMVGVDPVGARALAARTNAWGRQADHIIDLINQAVTLSDVACGAGSQLSQISSDGRTVARAIYAAVAQIEAYRVTLPPRHFAITIPRAPGLGFEPGLGTASSLAADARARAPHDPHSLHRRADAPRQSTPTIDAKALLISRARRLFSNADLLESARDSVPDYWWYARLGSDDEIADLRARATQAIDSVGTDSTALRAAISTTSLTSHELARQVELGRAQELAVAAQALPPTLESRRRGIRQQVTAIQFELYRSDRARAIARHPQLDPITADALISFDSANRFTDGLAVADAKDPARVLELIIQGYPEASAIAFVASAPSSGPDSLTIAELDRALRQMKYDGQAQSAEYTSLQVALNARVLATSGQSPTDADLAAASTAEVSGASYNDVLAGTADHRIATNQLTGQELDAELTRLVEQQWRESPRYPQTPTELQRTGYLGDTAAHVSHLKSFLAGGVPLVMAQQLSRGLATTMTPDQILDIGKTAASLARSGHDESESVTLALFSLDEGLDAIQIGQTALDERIGLTDALTLTLFARQRGMTVAEYHAYTGLLDASIFAALDNVQGGEADDRISIEDLDFAIANEDRLDLPDEVAAVAHAFRQSPSLMTRLDTGRDFNEGVLGQDPVGRDRHDDLLWSRDDLHAFELKQNINVLLANKLGTIDAANESREDGHLAKSDFTQVLSDPQRYGLSPHEVLAVQAVIDGRFYDQRWIEANRDSIAIGAAIVAAIAATAFTLGAAGPPAAAGVGVVAGGGATATSGGAFAAAAGLTATGAVAGGVAAGTTTVSINAVGDEDFFDGALYNTFNGALVGTQVATGTATASALFASGTRTGAVAGTGLAFGEAAGVISSGALDWAADTPLGGPDSIDLARLKNRANLVNAGASIATLRVTKPEARIHQLARGAAVTAGLSQRPGPSQPDLSKLNVPFEDQDDDGTHQD